jgi:hypothetical protein
VGVGMDWLLVKAWGKGVTCVWILSMDMAGGAGIALTHCNGRQVQFAIRGLMNGMISKAMFPMHSKRAMNKDLILKCVCSVGIISNEPVIHACRSAR